MRGVLVQDAARGWGVFGRFLRGEDGLVTVEWVALAAAMVVGAVSIGWLVAVNLKAPSNQIGTKINGIATTTITQPHP